MTKFFTHYRDLLRNQSRKNITKKQWIAFLILISSLSTGVYFWGHYNSTGLFPVSLLNRPESILPPKCDPHSQTFKDVLFFMQSDDTDTIPYTEGFNCVDSVFRVWLNARWKGILAVPIAIQYEDGPGHTVIGFPTADRGDVFFETQSDQMIRPRVGMQYNGEKIRGFYFMDVIWAPLDGSPEYDSGRTLK